MPYQAGPNTANYNLCASDWYNPSLPIGFTSVGSNGGPSAYGTFDQTGNVNEWINNSSFSSVFAVYTGGGFNSNFVNINKFYINTASINQSFPEVGFRIASSTNPHNLPFIVQIGDINNISDQSIGSVAYEYQIGQFQVTICEYAEFLNAIAKTDLYNLYKPNLMNILISRSGQSGNFTYTPINKLSNKPMVFVTYLDAIRYCNWLHNNKPSGPQSNLTTERGAYVLDGLSSGFVIPIKTDVAKYWVPTRNEWYKAAYYKAGDINAGYWNYATQSDELPLCIQGNTNGDGPTQTSYSCNITVTTTTTTPPPECTAIGSPYTLITPDNKNVSVSESFSGWVSTWNICHWTSCTDVYVPNPCKKLGSTNLGFVYKLNFSQPINNLVIILASTGSGANENFIITSPNNTISIIPIKSCFTSINGNEILSGAGSPELIDESSEGFLGGGYGGGGGIFCVNGSSSFTEITISGDGGQGGSLFALCSRLLASPPPTTTTTTSTTSTTTTQKPDSSFFFIHDSKLYLDSSVIDFNKPNKNYCVRVNLVNPITEEIIQYIDHCVDVSGCICVETTTTTTSTCPPITYPEVLCSNGIPLGNYPIFDNNGCIIAYECPPTTTTTTTTLPPGVTTTSTTTTSSTTTLPPVSTLYTWGVNLYGELGSGDPYNSQSGIVTNPNPSGVAYSGHYVYNPTPIGSGFFTNVWCNTGLGKHNTSVLDISGNLYACGIGYFGEFPHNYIPYPQPPQTPTTYYQLQRKTLTLVEQDYIFNPIDRNLAIPKTGGTVNSNIKVQNFNISGVYGEYPGYWPNFFNVPWFYGQWGSNPQPMLSTNIKIKKIDSNFTDQTSAVTPYGGHSLAISTFGELYGYGENYYRQLGLAPTSGNKVLLTYRDRILDSFTKLNNKNNWIDASAGYRCSLAIDSAGDLYGCGWNAYYQLGTQNQISLPVWTKIQTNMPPLKRIYAGGGCSFGLTYNNELYRWGIFPGSQTIKNPIKVSGMLDGQPYNDNWIEVFTNSQSLYTLLLNNSGELYQLGQVNGRNQFPLHAVPTKITEPSGVFWTQADVGINHAAALGIKIS